LRWCFYNPFPKATLTPTISLLQSNRSPVGIEHYGLHAQYQASPTHHHHRNLHNGSTLLLKGPANTRGGGCRGWAVTGSVRPQQHTPSHLPPHCCSQCACTPQLQLCQHTACVMVTLQSPYYQHYNPNIVKCWTNSGTGPCHHNRGWVQGWGIRLSIVTKIYLPSPLPPC
jgi:hypothetical protein